MQEKFSILQVFDKYWRRRQESTNNFMSPQFFNSDVENFTLMS